MSMKRVKEVIQWSLSRGKEMPEGKWKNYVSLSKDKGEHTGEKNGKNEKNR